MSFAERRFAKDAWLLALAGCFFPKVSESVKTPVGRWYWAYSVACICFTSAFEVSAFVGRATSSSRGLLHFTSTLFLILRTVFFAKVLAQYASLLFRSGEVSELVSWASKYERARNLRVKYRFMYLRMVYRYLYFVIATAFFATRWHVFVRTFYRDSPLFFGAVLELLTLVSASIVTVWDSIHSVLVKCFSEIFVEYLRAENVVLKAVSERRLLCFSCGPTAIIDCCTTNFDEILRMVVRAQSLLRFKILLGFACNMVIFCTFMYTFTDNKASTSLLFSASFYAALIFADTLDVACAADRLRNEVSKLTIKEPFW